MRKSLPNAFLYDTTQNAFSPIAVRHATLLRPTAAKAPGGGAQR
jgi:hypothetical protein